MIAQPTSTTQLSADGFKWNESSPRVATITNELNHFQRVCYFAFDSWDEAHNFWKSITDKRVCGRAQVRESERFTSHSWEVKVWSLRQDVFEKLIERDRHRQPIPLPLPRVRRDWDPSASHSVIGYEAA